MKTRKERLTVTIDRDLVKVANAAVAAGRADSVSGWVNAALAARALEERRLLALAEAVAAYEARFGEITTEELRHREREDRRSAIVVRGQHRARRPRKGTR